MTCDECSNSASPVEQVTQLYLFVPSEDSLTVLIAQISHMIVHIQVQRMREENNESKGRDCC